jgi:transposase
MGFQNLLNAHGKRIGIPQDAIYGTLDTAYYAWQKCFKKLARKPKLKGYRNRLNSIAFAHGTRVTNGRVHVPLLGRVRFHKQQIPEGHIGQFRLINRASGWYACLSIQAEPKAIPHIADGQIGIDSGFSTLLTLSNGGKVAHPRELEASALRLGQSQRGLNRKLTVRIQERITNQRKDRNHKLSRKLVSENSLIAFSADRHSAIAKRFGKSVTSSGHGQLRSMLSYKAKCRTDGHVVYVEVDSRNSTRTCSACGALTGPQGLAGLKVRLWKCSACGAEHDRDINAAINTLHVGAGLAHETLATAA